MDERIAAILAQVDPVETIELARALVRIPSITGQEGPAISRYVLDWLQAAGIPSGAQVVEPGRVNVWARLDGGLPGPRLLLNGHLDTKPTANMTIDPFSAEVRDGRLYGRGACDMKSAVAGLMVALRAVARSGVPLAGSLLFGAEVGEEGGGWRLIDLVDGPCACDAIVCGEPTALEVHVGARGGFQIAVTTRGRAIHTGMAYQGVNAVEKMAAIIQALYALPCFHRRDPIWGRSPINAMTIQGGGKVSASVPDECETIFDIRLNPDLAPEEMHATLEGLLAQMRAADPDLDVDWRPYQLGGGPGIGDTAARPATAESPDSPLIAAAVAAVEDALGTAPRLGGFPGGCSAHVLQRRGIPGVIVGPGHLTQAHTADEWIAIDEIGAAARVYAALAARYLEPGRW